MKEKRKSEPVFVKKKASFKDFSVEIYSLLEKIRFIIPFLNRLLKRYRLYYPGNSKECAAAAGKCLIKIYLTSALVFIIVLGIEPSFYSGIVACFLSYVFSMEFITSSYIKMEIKFLKAFDNFLSTGRHQYYKYGSITDALQEAESGSDEILRGHIREMLTCLSSAGQDAAVLSYVNSGYHKYLKLYLTLARLVDENGDISDENGSVFLNSCMRLKIDVEEDLRFIEDRRHRFSGLTLTASLPALAIPFIGRWGVSTIESLNGFYNGCSGTALKVVLLLISLAGYNAILNLKCRDMIEKKEHALSARLAKNRCFSRLVGIVKKLSGRKTDAEEERIKRLCERYSINTFICLKLLYFIAGFFIALLTLSIGHLKSGNIYKYDIMEVQELSSLTDARQIEALDRLIPYYTEKFCEEEIIPSKTDLSKMLLNDKDLKSEAAADRAAEEIIRRITLYKEENFGIADILLCILSGLVAFCIPGLSLAFRKTLIESRMQDEVMQFQSIIHMLKKISGIQNVSLLEEMELFSEIFRPSIRQCLNEYNISDEAALQRLYEREKYPGFRRLVDCFLMADELGIEDAFEEISAEIENFTENRKLERKITLDAEGMLGSVIAVLPGGLILFGYLLCPFLIRSLQIFNDYQAGLGML